MLGLHIRLRGSASSTLSLICGPSIRWMSAEHTQFLLLCMDPVLHLLADVQADTCHSVGVMTAWSAQGGAALCSLQKAHYRLFQLT